MLRTSRLASATLALLLAAGCGGGQSAVGRTGVGAGIPAPAAVSESIVARGFAAKTLSESPIDLPGGLVVPAAPPYTGRLMVVTIEVGGRGAPHIHGGSETLYVVQGTARLKLADGDHVLTAGQSLTHAAATPIQDINGGDVPLVMLAYFVTPAGAAFRTDLSAGPGDPLTTGSGPSFAP